MSFHSWRSCSVSPRSSSFSFSDMRELWPSAGLPALGLGAARSGRWGADCLAGSLSPTGGSSIEAASSWAASPITSRVSEELFPASGSSWSASGKRSTGAASSAMGGVPPSSTGPAASSVGGSSGLSAFFLEARFFLGGSSGEGAASTPPCPSPSSGGWGMRASAPSSAGPGTSKAASGKPSGIASIPSMGTPNSKSSIVILLFSFRFFDVSGHCLGCFPASPPL